MSFATSICIISINVILYLFIQHAVCVKEAGVFFTFSCRHETAGCMVAALGSKSQFPPAGCVQVLAGLSGVGSSHAEAVLSVLRARREEIRRSLLDRTNSISSATLQDFDWQLKVTWCFFSLVFDWLTYCWLDCNGGTSPANVFVNDWSSNNVTRMVKAVEQRLWQAYLHC